MKRASSSFVIARSGSRKPKCGFRSCVWSKVACLALVLAAGVPEARAQSTLAERLLAAADSAYRAFAPREALALYEAASARAPGGRRFEVLMGQIRSHFDLGLDLLAEPGADAPEPHFERSVALARDLVVAFPHRAESHFMLGAMLGNLAQFRGGRARIAIAREVEHESLAAIARDSSFAYPYVTLGVLHRELARLTWVEAAFVHLAYGAPPEASLESALAYLNRAAELAPLAPIIHHELALTYEAAGRPDASVPHLKQLLVLKPETSQDVRNRERARRRLAALSGQG